MHKAYGNFEGSDLMGELLCWNSNEMANVIDHLCLYYFIDAFIQFIEHINKTSNNIISFLGATFQ